MSKHPEALATTVVGLSLLWNERSGRQNSMNDFGRRIDAVKTELGQKIKASKADLTRQIGSTKTDLTTQIVSTKTDLTTQIDATKAKLSTEVQNTQSIAVGSAYATMKAFSGKRSVLSRPGAQRGPAGDCQEPQTGRDG